MTPAELYNLCCLALHGPNKLKSLLESTGKAQMTVSSFSPTSFCHTELQRALKEQAFGIKSYTMVSSSPDQATALVVLLEGRKISVQLTTRGYWIAGTPTIHESAESLLIATSPQYARKHQEALTAKLASLS